MALHFESASEGTILTIPRYLAQGQKAETLRVSGGMQLQLGSLVQICQWCLGREAKNGDLHRVVFKQRI